MGDRNQWHYLSRRKFDGPVLEIGSKSYTGNTADFRQMFPDFLGVDLQPGAGVDVVADLSQPHDLPKHHFGLVICCSVLEHCRDPWAMARNITELVRPGGSVYIAVPWVWRYHDYPDDYWRFSWSGIKALFPEIEWEAPEFSTTREGDFFPAMKDADNNLAVVIEGRKFLPYLMLNMLGTWTTKTS